MNIPMRWIVDNCHGLIISKGTAAKIFTIIKLQKKSDTSGSFPEIVNAVL